MTQSMSDPMNDPSSTISPALCAVCGQPIPEAELRRNPYAPWCSKECGEKAVDDLDEELDCRDYPVYERKDW